MQNPFALHERTRPVVVESNVALDRNTRTTFGFVMGENPYQPPTEIREDETSTDGYQTAIRQFDEIGPIPFSGNPGHDGLNRFLANYDNVNWSTIILAFFLCGSGLMFFALVRSTGMFLVWLGGSCFVLAGITVSTRFYRKLMFTDANPDWSDVCIGEVNQHGIRIQRSHSTVFSSWDCVSRIVVQPDSMAIIIPDVIGQSLILTRDMLKDDGDHFRLKHWLQRVNDRHLSSGTEADRMQILQVLQRDPTRARTIEVPTDAIAFSGAIHHEDVMRVRGDVRPRRLRVRARIVQLAILLSITLIASGVFLLLGIDGPETILLLAATIILWSRWARRGRPQSSSSNTGTYQYLNGFINHEGITADASAVVTTMPWSQIKVVKQADDFVCLRHTSTPRILIAKRDMFETQTEWSSFNQIIDSHNCH